MSAPCKTNQNLVDEIKTHKLLCLNLEMELKKKRLELKTLALRSEEMSKKFNATVCENQVLNADIALSKAQSNQVDLEIDSMKTEIEVSTIKDERSIIFGSAGRAIHQIGPYFYF
uniref:Uncharacterized protein n=1 Tax=Cacopsylla melanoneura TaxID=428564 RepID=A0A8D8Q6V6_9HEMI